jgi:hypothetical protein
MNFLIILQFLAIVVNCIDNKIVYSKKKFDQNCSNFATSPSLNDRCDFYKCFEVCIYCIEKY